MGLLSEVLADPVFGGLAKKELGLVDWAGFMIGLTWPELCAKNPAVGGPL